MGLGRLGGEGDGAFQVDERLGHVALLAQDIAHQAVRRRVALVDAKGFGELCPGLVQLAAAGGLPGPLKERIGGAGARGTWLAGRRLLSQGHAQGVVAFAKLGIEHDRLLQGDHRARKIAALT